MSLSARTWWNKVIVMANRADCHPPFPCSGRLIPLTDCLSQWLLAAVFVAWGPVWLREREREEFKKWKRERNKRSNQGERKHFCVCLWVCVCVCVVAMLSLGPNLFSKTHDPVRNSEWLMSGLTGREGSMCVCVYVYKCVCVPLVISISSLKLSTSTCRNTVCVWGWINVMIPAVNISACMCALDFLHVCIHVWWRVCLKSSSAH